LLGDVVPGPFRGELRFGLGPGGDLLLLGAHGRRRRDDFSGSVGVTYRRLRCGGRPARLHPAARLVPPDAHRLVLVPALDGGLAPVSSDLGLELLCARRRGLLRRPGGPGRHGRGLGLFLRLLGGHGFGLELGLLGRGVLRSRALPHELRLGPLGGRLDAVPALLRHRAALRFFRGRLFGRRRLLLGGRGPFPVGFRAALRVALLRRRLRAPLLGLGLCLGLRRLPVRRGEGDDVGGGGAGALGEGPFEAPETKQRDDRDHQNEAEEGQGRQLEHRGVYGRHVFPFGAL
jgi:hypothetical protein